MFSRRDEEIVLPGWLWFFLILPIVLIVALLYRQKRLPQIMQRLRSLRETLPAPLNPASRYTEPDSIPLEIRTGEAIVIEEEGDTAGEDVAIARAAAAQENEVAQSEAQAPEAPVPEAQQTGTPQPEAEQPAQDELEIIEGIGPAIARLLRNAGLVTFRQLAATPPERLDEILTNAHLRRLADPGTWPEQAALAAAGDWDGLKQLQDTLKGGRRPKAA